MNRAARWLLTSLKWLCIVTGVLLAIYFALTLFLNLNWLREPISRKVFEKTGRELRIEGDLRLRPGWPLPRVRAEKVSFTNPGWAREPYMFKVDKAEVAVSLPHLLVRQLRLSEVLVADPVVNLEIATDGRRTWLLDPEQKSQQRSVGIGRLKIDKGRLTFINRQENIDLAANFDVNGEGPPQSTPWSRLWSWWPTSWKKLWQSSQAEGDADLSADAGVDFTIKGKFRGSPVDLQGKGGSVFSIRDERYPYPLKASGKIGDATVSVDGTVNGLTTLSAMNVKAALQGRDLAVLNPVLGVTLPNTKPYATAGRVRHQADLWYYEGFTARVGGSDLAGNLNVRRGGKGRTALNGDFSSHRLQLADFPASGDKPTEKAKNQGLLPKAEFDTAAWDTLDADVRLRVAALDAGKLPLRDLALRALLKDKVATLQDLNVKLAGGSVSGSLSLDGTAKPAKGKARLQVQGLQFTELLPAAARATDKVQPGRMDGRADLSGTGNSVDSLLSSSDGRLSVVVNGGQISNFALEAVGIDLWEMLKFKMAGDRNVAIRCGIADFGVKQGVAQAQVAVLDTEDTKVNITGSIDIGHETLDLTLHPEPKDMSPLALRGPIHVHGPLDKPQVSLDKKNLAARGLGALALAVVNPLLAIAPLIETGPGKDSDCGALVEEAKAFQVKAARQEPTGTADAGKGARSKPQ